MSICKKARVPVDVETRGKLSIISAFWTGFESSRTVELRFLSLCFSFFCSISSMNFAKFRLIEIKFMC